MPLKALAPRPDSEHLVFPFELRLGDVIVDDRSRAEVVGPPSADKNGRTTRGWVQREGETIQRAMVWEAWRKVRVVVRMPAA